MIGTMYGTVCGDYPGSDTWQSEFDKNWVEPTLYLLRFNVIELAKDASFRPPGICYVTVVFASAVAVPTLQISPEQSLFWGGDARLDADLNDMLPFSTGPYHGFRRLGSNELVGHGAFFSTAAEAEARAQLGSGTNVVKMI